MRTPVSREPSASHWRARAEQAVELAECQLVELQALRAQNEVLRAEMDAMRAAAQAEAAMLRVLLASSLAEAEGQLDTQLTTLVLPLHKSHASYCFAHSRSLTAAAAAASDVARALSRVAKRTAATAPDSVACGSPPSARALRW